MVKKKLSWIDILSLLISPIVIFLLICRAIAGEIFLQMIKKCSCGSDKFIRGHVCLLCEKCGRQWE